jgi:hypothetical protein
VRARAELIEVDERMIVDVQRLLKRAQAKTQL